MNFLKAMGLKPKNQDHLQNQPSRQDNAAQIAHRQGGCCGCNGSHNQQKDQDQNQK